MQSVPRVPFLVGRTMASLTPSVYVVLLALTLGYLPGLRQTRAEAQGFSDGELVRETSDSRIYITYGNATFLIPDSQTFDAMKFDPNDVDVVPDGDLATAAVVPEDGTLLQEFSDPAVYIVVNGARSLIPDLQTFTALGFSQDDIAVVPDGSLAAVPRGLDASADQIAVIDAATDRVIIASQGPLPCGKKRQGPCQRPSKFCRCYLHPLKDVDQCPNPGLYIVNRHSSCRAVMGWITSREASTADSDYNFNIRLDTKKWILHHLLNNSETYDEHPYGGPGTLHVEVMRPDQPSCDASQEQCNPHPAYRNGHDGHPRVKVGQYVEVAGVLVTDDKHVPDRYDHGKAEIHPAWKIKIIRRSTQASASQAYDWLSLPAYPCSTRCCDDSLDENWPATSEDVCRDHAHEVCLARHCRGAKRIRFNHRVILHKGCDCCAQCNNRTKHYKLEGVCEDCTAAADDWCSHNARGGLRDAKWGQCELPNNELPNNPCEPGVCGTYSSHRCGENSECGCRQRADGGSFCDGVVSPCGDLDSCDGNLTCPAGFVCVVETCCNRPVCEPLSDLCASSATGAFVGTVGPGTDMTHEGRMTVSDGFEE